MHELPVDKKKLEELVNKCKHCRINSIDLPSYYRGIKENSVITSLLTELVDSALEYLSASTNTEIENLLISFPPRLARLLEPNPSWKDDEYLMKISIYYIVVEVERNRFSFQQIVNENIANSATLSFFPELKDRLDSDGLLFIDKEFILHDYGIEYKNYIIQYHRFLRSRYYMSYSNSSFLGRWIDYYQQTKARNQFRIAIEHHYPVKPKEAYSQILEFDTWYGPPFKKKQLDDLNAVGLTIVKRNKNCLFENEYSLDRTEFFWSFRDGIKTFEVEEISDDKQFFEQYYFNKYVHSERDVNKKILHHLDGAVKIYLKNDYSKRKELFLPSKESYKKIKLWRIDGDINLEDWIELIALFYKGNEMIYEYFDPIGFEQKFDLRIRDFKAWKQQQSSKS